MSTLNMVKYLMVLTLMKNVPNVSMRLELLPMQKPTCDSHKIVKTLFASMPSLGIAIEILSIHEKYAWIQRAHKLNMWHYKVSHMLCVWRHHISFCLFLFHFLIDWSSSIQYNVSKVLSDSVSVTNTFELFFYEQVWSTLLFEQCFCNMYIELNM